MRSKYKYMIMTLLVGLFCGNLYSQSEYEEPQYDLDKLKGKAKVEALNNLAEFYLKNEFDKSFKYAEEAVSYSEQNNLVDELDEALCFLGLCYYLKNDLTQAEQILTRSLDLATKENDSLLIARNYNNLGLVYWRHGEFRTAFRYYIRAKEIADVFPSLIESAKANNYIGLIQWKWGDFDSALEYFLKSLEQKKAVNDSSEIAITLNNIAHLYYLTGDFNASLKYSQDAYSTASKIEDRYVMGRALNNLGNVYMKLGDYTDSEKYHLQAIEVKTKANDKTGLGYSYNDLGNLYIELGNGQKAIEYYNKSLKIREELSDFYGISETYISLAKANDFLGRSESALSLLNRSIDISQKHNLKELLHRGYLQLSKVNEKLGRLGHALYYYKNASAMKDSIMNKNILDRIAELSIVYEYESQKIEIGNLKKEARLNDVELELERTTNYLLLALLVVLIFAIVFLYYRYRVSSAYRKSLEEKNKEIEQRTLELERAIETKNKFLSIISHDLRSPFLGLLGTIDFTVDEYDSLSDEEKLTNISSVKNISQNLYRLIENLLGWAKMEQRDFQFSPTNVNLYNKVENALKFSSANSDMKKIVLINKVEEDHTVYADENMLSSILTNLISNAVKFTPPGGKVSIETNREGDFEKICICDSGIGMSEEAVSKLFRPDTKYTTLGTAKEKGTGFGLLICKEMVEIHGGKIWVESKEGVGSKFQFTLPLRKND